MNWLDIVILCIAGAGLVKGLVDGVIKQIVSLVALVAGIFFCGKMADWLNNLMSSWGLPEIGSSILSHVLGFLIIVGVLILIGEIMHRVIDATPLSILNHLGGGFFGFILTLLFISLIFNLLEIIDPHSALIPNEAKVESHFYFFIKQIIPTIFPKGIFYITE
jgi:membrane protein required for colicin V production